MKIEIGELRRDGKFPVSLIFAGSPNAFGGFYPGKTYRKLYTLAQVQEKIAKHGTEEQKQKWSIAGTR